MTSSDAHPADHDLDLGGPTDFDSSGSVPLKVFTDPVDGSRVAAFVPAGVRLTTLDQARALRAVQSIGSELVRLRMQLDQDVAAARAAGLSWSAIGFSVGMTGEGARARWNDVAEEG